MLISDVLNTYPETVAIFERHGLACGKCLAAGMESLGAVANAHDVDIEGFMADLNAFVAGQDGSTEGREQ